MIVPSLPENLKKSQDKQLSGKHSAVTIALKTMYWMVKEGSALTQFRSPLNFFKVMELKT